MKTLVNILTAALLTALIIGLAMWMVPSSNGEVAPTVIFRYTTSIPETAHMVKVGDVILDSLQKPYMKVASVTVRHIREALITPSGTATTIDNPAEWEVIFKTVPFGKGILPKFVVGGSMYIETPRWKKLVRVIEVEK